MKTVYVYENAACSVSTSYHSGGGLMIVTAGDPGEAWRASEEYAAVLKKEPQDAGNPGEPDHVFEIPDSGGPDVIVTFPDMGCC